MCGTFLRSRELQITANSKDRCEVKRGMLESNRWVKILRITYC